MTLYMTIGILLLASGACTRLGMWLGHRRGVRDAEQAARDRRSAAARGRRRGIIAVDVDTHLPSTATFVHDDDGSDAGQWVTKPAQEAKP